VSGPDVANPCGNLQYSISLSPIAVVSFALLLIVDVGVVLTVVGKLLVVLDRL
jgi:hypothetical protein